MKFIDKITGKVQDWFLSVALKKGAKRAAAVIIAWIISQPLEQDGIKAEFDQTLLAAALVSIIEVAKNYIQHRWFSPKEEG